MSLNSLPIPAVWCDFNASAWSQEESDNCYYIFNKEIIGQLENITESVIFAYMSDNIEETVFVGCQAQIESYKNDHRIRPIQDSWITGTTPHIRVLLAKPLLVVNEQKIAVYTREDLQRQLLILPQDSLLEIRMETPEGPWLCCLTHKTCAWIMFIRFSGDPGFSSRGSDASKTEVLPFRLSNGQVDEYPKSWTLPLATAYKAITYFWEHQEKLPTIQWHDDSL